MRDKTMAGELDYNSARLWQVGLFTLNNSATNLYLFIIGFVSYYVTGVAGVAVVAASFVIGGSRVFDAITDPIIGFVIDKTESKFGKFRPLMVLGNIILAGSVLIMYNFTHLLPQSLQLPFFILMYVVYIIGYTFQTACTKAAQTVLTNNPKQRPLYSIFDTLYNIGIFTGGQVIVASYLVEKHGDFTMSLFTELNTYAIVLSGIFTILAVIAIWEKDRKEYFGLANATVNTRFRDYWPILKGNRPLQMLVIAASTDKIATMVLRQPAVYIMFFGIMMGNYELSGTVSLITIIPSVIITFLGVRIATKNGLKNALVKATWIGVSSAAFLFVYFLIIDAKTISLENMGLTTVIFLIGYFLLRGIEQLTPSIVVPMVADVADYETSETGRYVPGMIGTIFSFIDKVMSSAAPLIVGLVVAMIGYENEFPQLGDPLTTPLLMVTLFLMFGIPIIGWVISLIAMKFYELHSTKMNEVQENIYSMKSVKDENSSNDKVGNGN
ncbi:sugar transporter [Lentibacillus kapialis]|uniref:Sugar transporter n=1 Tax=Lentibacillus kapialis TaxID=340214 RepID=A0A917PPX4_9BACI|nr:MFS transporter [Lentibacillus kapialis]GGJ87747.1 sugar transporter [Lentibacillus kapialis]